MQVSAALLIACLLCGPICFPQSIDHLQTNTQVIELVKKLYGDDSVAIDIPAAKRLEHFVPSNSFTALPFEKAWLLFSQSC